MLMMPLHVLHVLLAVQCCLSACFLVFAESFQDLARVF